MARTVSTWTDFINDPDAEKITLAVVHPAFRVSANSGLFSKYVKYQGPQIYRFTFTPPRMCDGFIEQVMIDGEPLTYVNNILQLFNGTVETGAFFIEPTTITTTSATVFFHCKKVADVWTEITAYENVLFGVRFFLSTHPACIYPNHAAETQTEWLRNVYYEPLIKSAPMMSVATDSFIFGGAAPSGGTLVLHNGQDSDYGSINGPFDLMYPDYVWRHRKVELYVGGENLPHDLSAEGFQKSWTGLILEVSLTETEFTLSLSSALQFLEKKLPEQTYKKGAAGTGANHETFTYEFLEDNRDGQAVPICIGTCYNVPMIRIHFDSLIHYRLCGHRINKVLAIRQRGIPIYKDGDPLNNPTYPVAAIDTDLGIVSFRFLGETLGALTCDVEGYVNETDKFIEEAGDILHLLFTTYASIPPEYIDLDALSRLNTGVKHGIFIAQPQKLEEIVTMLDKGLLAWHTVTRDGKLTIQLWKQAPWLESGAVIETFDGDTEMNELKFTQAQDNLYRVVKIGYQKNWTIQSDTAAGDPLTSNPMMENWSHDYRWVEYRQDAAYNVYGCDETLLVETYLSDKTQAEAIAAVYTELTRTPWLKTEFETQLRPLTYGLGQAVYLNYRRLPEDFRYQQIIEIAEQGDSNTVKLTTFRTFD